MWWTQQGKRTLAGAERELYVRMAYSLWQDLESELENEEFAVPSGVAAFDRLSVPQRFVILAEVTAGLLDRKVQCVPLTQANEAAIAAVYQAGSSELVDCSLYEDFRHLLRAAAKQFGMTHLPALGASNREHGELVERLRDRILWDADYEMESMALDLPREQGRQLHGQMGISDDYFTTLVADPRDIAPHRALLEKHLGRPSKSYLPRRPSTKMPRRVTRKRER